MDVFMLMFFSCVSLLVGIILTLVVQYYVLLKYFNKNPTVSPPKKPHAEACSLPEMLKKKLELEGYDDTDSSLAISLMLQFLFHELRHSDSIKRWLYKKLSLEFDELINKTTTGKFFDAVRIRDMHLGSQFPNIKSISIENVKLDKNEGHIDTLNLCLKLDYTGNFLMSVDARMKFGKTAYLSIKVKHISGLARLQFTRLPYTHWSFAFYTEPDIDLAVESHFQGRQLQSNVTNLIVNQIKKAIKRKHTLPNYKIRYKPFFVKSDPGQLDVDETEIVPQGQLEVMCVEISRLATTPDVVHVYCTFATDSAQWICIYQKESLTYMVLEITISKVRQQHLGVTFRQDQNLVTVESVASQTPADIAGLRVGDILVAVDGKTVNNVTQTNKLIKLASAGSFSVRVERLTSNYVLKSKYPAKAEDRLTVTNSSSIGDMDVSQVEQDSFVIVDAPKTKCPEPPVDAHKKSKTTSITSPEKFKACDKIPKLITSGNENVSKFAQTIGNFTLRKRKQSVDRIPIENSPKTAPASNPTTPQHKLHSIPMIPAATLMSVKKNSITEIPEMGKEEAVQHFEYAAAACENPDIEMFRGQTKDLQSVIAFNDEYSFDLRESDKYLNVNVWGVTISGREVLLGYINISLGQILNECCNSLLGHYIKSYSFLPPTNMVPTSQSHPLISHSGFEHVFCYGDALLSFMWTHDDLKEIKHRPSTCDADLKHLEMALSQHDFVRTQFNRTTHCDFCSKKIWLKDAVQCKSCQMCCHKKCVAKCQVNMPCLPADKPSFRVDVAEAAQPDSNMSACGDEDTESESSPNPTPEQKPTNNTLKRVNSANNLAIPGSHVASSHSRSLPPSPQHTPRKLSLVAGHPFGMCSTILDEVQQQPEEAADSISRMVEQVLQYPPDEALMDAAKETGMQQYVGIPHQAKVEKINFMVSELKKALDAITLEHMELSRQLGSTESEVEKTKLAFLIGQADAKVHALSVLMLHYCAGLQHTQEKIV